MSNKQISIGKWLNNDKFVAVLSVLLALVIWLVVALQMSNQMQATFNEIPVTFETTMTDNLELKMFGQTDVRVNVTVSGKRYEISSAVLSSEDFIVTASTANVSSAGKYTLPISVRMKDSNKDIQIVSFTPQSVDIYFDFSLTQSFPVEVQIMTPDGKIAEDDAIAAESFIAGEPLVSPTEVTISGAAAEVQKIAKVVAKVTLDEPLTKTAKYEDTALAIVNANGGIVRSTYARVEDSISAVTVMIPITKHMQIRPSIVFTNQPAYFVENPIIYNWTPSGPINVAVPTDLSDSAESLPIETRDFSEVKPGLNTFEFACDEIEYIRVLDDIDSLGMSFTLDGFQMRKIAVPTENAKFDNLPEGVRASIPEDTIEVTVFGHADELETLTADNISIVIDTSGLTDTADTYDLPATAVIKDTKTCWGYGTYTVRTVVS